MQRNQGETWPALPLEAWRDTCDTLHMWTQVVGKIRLTLMPWINHGWHVPLYVTARGLGTAVMPAGPRSLAIEFDFVDHELDVRTSDGARGVIPLRPVAVALFYEELMSLLHWLGVAVDIRTIPSEVESSIPFDQDYEHASYDPIHAHRFWRILAATHRLLTVFRARFTGKVSPIHFFWGSFDLAVTRFSGRPAPPHPGGIPGLPDRITREAYSHEVSSAGWWPGNGRFGQPAFYSYAYPAPDGFAEFPVRPAEAFYSAELGEFLLPYDAMRQTDDPDNTLLAFLQSTYEAAAEPGHWDREALEREDGPP